jgi:glycosyltransferase involved in cell wall biosynthesis/polysaccharide pyruvyl transferase WcaK-like protein
MTGRPVRSILITHVWSDRNKGDAAILAATLRQIGAAAPGCSVTLGSEFGTADRRAADETDSTRRQFPGTRLVGSLLPILPLEPPGPARASVGWQAAVQTAFYLARSVLLLMAPSVRLCRGEAERQILRAFRSADLVVSKGGGFLFGEMRLRSTLRLYREVFPLLLARRLRRPVALLGQSIGPFASDAQRALMRRALNGAVMIGVREAISQDLLRDLGVGGPAVRIVPDLALALPPAEPDDPRLARLASRLEAHPRPWIGLTVRAWRLHPRDDATIENYLAAVDALGRHIRRRYGGTVIVWPQSTGPGAFEDDRRVGQRLGARGHDGLVLVEDEIPAPILKAAYGWMDAFVATRFHSALFAMASGVPSIVIDYWGPKARGIMRQAGQEQFVIPYAAVDPAGLCGLFDALWAERAAVRARLRATIPALVADIEGAVGDLMRPDAATVDVESRPRPTPGRDRGALAVLLVGLNSSFGGVEQHMLDLGAGLARRGHRVTLAAPAGSAVAALARRRGMIETVEVSRSPLAVPALAALIRRVRPDVVHLHSPRASLLGRIAARLLPFDFRRRLVVLSSAHGWIPRYLRFGSLFEMLYGVTARWEDGIVAVAGAVKATLLDHRYPGEIWTVANGLDPLWGDGIEAAPREPGTPLRLGYFGRLDREKGVGVLVDALRRLDRPAWRLDVYGGGRSGRAVARQIADAGLDGQICLNGAVPRDAVAGVMAACHVVVLPSLQEGSPYVVLEAIRLGVPVVACAVGGVVEMIRNGEDGLLVPPGDAAALADALRRLIDDDRLLDRLRRGARGRRLTYTAEDMVTRLVEVYGEARSRARYP